MKRKAPKKNISPDIADIEKPGKRSAAEEQKRVRDNEPIKKRAAAEFVAEESEEPKNREAKPKPGFPVKKTIFVLLLCAIIAVGWFGAHAYARWYGMVDSLRISGVSIGRLFGSTDPDSEMSPLGDSRPSFDFSSLKAVFQNIGTVYGNFGKISKAGIDFAENLESLEQSGFDLLFDNRGSELIDRLKKIKADLAEIRDANKAMSSASFNLSNFLPVGTLSPLALDLQFDQAERFLDYITSWLESEKPHHVLVLFGNSAELRPGGGFTGSYADVTVTQGSVASIEVHDINDADRLLARSIVPPKPLQAIATRWRAADANWFFDFALSGAKTVELAEGSKLYRNASTTFEIVVAVSPDVVSDILDLTGPISLPDRKLSIDKNNFLEEIQKEVQARQGTNNPPKQILQVLEPLMLDRIRALSPGAKRELVSKFSGWTSRKDVMVYAKDPALQKFFTSYGIAGDVLALPSNFNGDYLAVVNANMGSKTDSVIRENVLFQSQVNLNGTASDHLTITRKHNGNKSSYWWRRAANENYLRVFTPPGASLLNFTGGWNRTLSPKVNYKASGYETDPLVAKIESTAKKDFNYASLQALVESGKNVFASWVLTEAGKTSTVKLDYSVRLFTPPADGVAYQFVFEKQAGASGMYQFEIYAPVGFRWKENQLPVFEYASDDPQGRIVFDLTLEKI